MSQRAIPCAVYRGGTSRGVFFHENDLPENEEERKKIFMRAIDAYNPSQINGLGSGTSHSSKVIVIGQSNDDKARLDYTFYQVGIGIPVVDSNGTCGNLMAAVGAFAVDEGLVSVADDEVATVTVLNTNIQRHIELEVPVKKGKAKVDGDYFIPGLVEPGSRYKTKIFYPGGEQTGKICPVEKISKVTVSDQSYQVSVLDIVNPFVYLEANAIGLTGREEFEWLEKNQAFLKTMNTIRDECAITLGFAKSLQEAQENTPAVPKIAVVAKPQDYTTISGRQIKAYEVDIIAKMISMGKLHRTFAGSGLYNLAAAILLNGTIPNQLANSFDGIEEQIVRIGHPDGVAEVRVKLTDDGEAILFVGLERSARRIMKGEIFIPDFG